MEPCLPKEQSMNRIISFKSLAATAVVLGAMAVATSAHARSDVQFSITLGTPGVYVQAAPVYRHPQHVYVQPAPIYVRPAPVYVRPAPVYGWGHQRPIHHGHPMNIRGPRGDFDRDGVPNRYDRFPGNPNRR